MKSEHSKHSLDAMAQQLAAASTGCFSQIFDEALNGQKASLSSLGHYQDCCRGWLLLLAGSAPFFTVAALHIS